MYMGQKIKKAMIIGAIALIGKFAFGAEKLLLNGNCTGQEVTGREAVEALIKNPKTKIVKWSEVEISEKTGKIKNKSSR